MALNNEKQFNTSAKLLNQKIQQNHALAHKQQGAALLVAMIIIFMLATMGVSSMRLSTLERRMASNSIQTAAAFHSAESNADIALNNLDNLNEAANIANYDDVLEGILSENDVVTIPVDLLQNIGLTSEAELRVVGLGPAYGYSSNFAGYRFEVVGSSSVDAVRATARVRQGFFRVAPKR